MHERLTIPTDIARGVLVTARDDAVKEAVRKNAEASDWEYHKPYEFLMRWAWCFKDELIDGVALLDRRRLPDPVISFSNMRNINVLAGYRIARNAQGLLNEITFNTAHFEDKDRERTWRFGEWGLLETLCHEQLHLKQQNFSKGPARRTYHNAEFCEMAERIGLHPTPISGRHYAPAEGAFAELLDTYDIKRPASVTVPDGMKLDWWELLPGKEIREGRSTLAKWQCPCGQIARIGKKEFFATCDLCHGKFEPAHGKTRQVIYEAPKDGNELPF